MGKRAVEQDQEDSSHSDLQREERRLSAEEEEEIYLRNVLYRYMNERETLGRESVTLARVIATVAKFSDDQLKAVIAKEEQRNSRWYGGTVTNTVQNLLASSHLSERTLHS
ncbi:unnamed protein product [Dracunculus medinensis]|uniref:GRIP domain-containing protein n=1 Tax=Dracunculus medinensis TaxID=318479 RepID=A0A3P7SWR2_DRAME|nr:unnamed protein product [Dracunculus medinensis]